MPVRTALLFILFTYCKNNKITVYLAIDVKKFDCTNHFASSGDTLHFPYNCKKNSVHLSSFQKKSNNAINVSIKRPKTRSAVYDDAPMSSVIVFAISDIQ